MKENMKYVAMIFVATLASSHVYADQLDTDAAPMLHQFQGKQKKVKNWGTLTGSLESNTIIYQDDEQTGVDAPDPIYASHNFLKLDYNLGKFSAGVQLEYYPELIQDFEPRMQGLGMPMKYLSYSTDFFSVTAGDFYEQLGSGLALRLWEDRQLGLNNSALGAKLTYNFLNQALVVKAMYGMPRDYLHSTGADYGLVEHFFDAYTQTQFGAADVSLSLFDVMKLQTSHRLMLEGSVVYRHQSEIDEDFISYVDDYNGYGDPTQTYSARLAYEVGSFAIRGEYVYKSKDLVYSPSEMNYLYQAGNAQVLEMNYSIGSFTTAATFRRLKNMESPIYNSMRTYAANTMNYLPALVQMQTYLLASHHPYATIGNGEAGGQIDLFYRFKRKSTLGGKYGMKLHVNASTYYALANTLSNYDESRLAYRDINVSVEKSISRKFKTNFLYSHQKYSPDKGNTEDFYTQDIFVADLLYKFSRKFSLRGELQYLYSADHKDKDWMAGVLEANISPSWSVYVSDMYNHGNTDIHYYSAGVNYTHGMVRVGASYGRNREGMVCSGGVCRMQSAYTGGNIQLSVLF